MQLLGDLQCLKDISESLLHQRMHRGPLLTFQAGGLACKDTPGREDSDLEAGGAKPCSDDSALSVLWHTIPP